MARREHPQRTPFYGVLLLMAAYLSVWLGSGLDAPWSILVYVLAAVIAAAGFLMTFRDYDVFRRH